jgi:drug/metabolite transporter (DMT)-like permease
MDDGMDETGHKEGAISLPSPRDRASSPSIVRQAIGSYGVYGLLLFVMIVWGASFVAARMVLSADTPGTATLSPTMLATVRFLLASAIFLPILVRQELRSPRLSRRDIPMFLLLGQLGISIYFWLQYTGVQLTNAGISSVLVVGMIPLATMVVSGITLKEPLGGGRAGALGVGAAGVIVVVSQRGLGVSADGSFLFGSLCLVANAACFALYSTLIRGIRDRYSSLTVTAGMMIAGTLGLLLLSLFTEDWHTVAALSAAQWGAILYLAVVCSVLAYFFYNIALSRIEAGKAAAWVYIEPPVSVLLGVAMLGETLTLQTVAGGLLILVSLMLTQRT